MTTPNMTLLYVDNPENSAAFYRRLLGQAPVELSPTFALFVLSSGLKLAMWSKHSVEPAATATGGGGRNRLYVRTAAAGGRALSAVARTGAGDDPAARDAGLRL